MAQPTPIELDEAEALLHAASGHLDNAALALRSVGYEEMAGKADAIVRDTDRLRRQVERMLGGV